MHEDPDNAMVPTDPHALAEVIIDLDAVAHNVRRLVAAAAPAQVMAVVKADGYNHGIVQVSRTALMAGATHVGVATFQEAFQLRTAGIDAPITAWMWYPGEDLSRIIDDAVTIGIPSLDHACALVETLKASQEEHEEHTGHASPGGGNSCEPSPDGDLHLAKRAQPASTPRAVPSVCLMFDSGLSRSGVDPLHWQKTVQLLAKAHKDGVVAVTGVMTHLSSADSRDGTEATDQQVQRFRAAIEYCRSVGLPVELNHMANTPATLTRPDTHYEMVRPGVGIYGVDPLDQPAGAGLRPAMTLRARVITTRVVPAGEGVSYGLTWRAPVDTRTAVVAIGYADGVPRSASGQFEVSIRGRRYPQIGRVCMDQVVVDLGPVSDTHVPEVFPGDWAVIFGESGPSVDEFAQRAGTITYEILTLPRCRAHKRVLPVRFAGLDFSAPVPAPVPSRAPAHAPVSSPTSASASTSASPPAPASTLACAPEPPARPHSILIATAEEMRECGRELGSQLSAGTVVILNGSLGAGKTTLTQGIAQGLGITSRIQSPTFAIVRTHKPGHPGGIGLLHMDAYRLLGDSLDPDALMESLDVDADLSTMVLVAEWGRGVVEQLSDRVLDIELEQREGETRCLTWTWL